MCKVPRYAVQCLGNGDFDAYLGDVDHCTYSFMQVSTTLHSGPKPQHIVVEEKVAEWIREKRGEGKRISRLVVLRTFLQLNPDMFGGKSAVGFMVKINRLFYAFLKRHNISIRAITSVGQTLPVGWETMGEKLPPDAIFKGVEAPKRVDKRTITYQILPENREAFGYPSRSLISLHVNPKGYSNESFMKKWVNESYRFRWGSAEQQKKSVFILDDFKPHNDDIEIGEVDIEDIMAETTDEVWWCSRYQYAGPF